MSLECRYGRGLPEEGSLCFFCQKRVTFCQRIQQHFFYAIFNIKIMNGGIAMKKGVTAGIMAAVMVGMSAAGAANVWAEEENSYFDVELTAFHGAEETVVHGMHKDVQRTYPCETECRLTLTEEGTYKLEKSMTSLENEDGVEIACEYTFEGSYEPGTEKKLVLNPAEKCTFSEDYGSLDGQSPIGTVNNKAGDQESDPASLEYFNTDYLAYSGNKEAKVVLNLDEGTFNADTHSLDWEYMWAGDNQVHIVQDVVQQYEMRELGQIIFYGASNFRMWVNMEEDMAPYQVQNHAVGGSTDIELMEYADQLLFPFKPSVVFIQTGSNDYTTGATMEEVFANKDKMYSMFQEALPDTKFIVMAGLPLPNRAEYWDLTVEVNNYLKQYCEEHENMYFVDGTDAILTDSGEEDMATGDGRYFNPEIFKEDGIHLTQEGHDLWTPYMIDILKELGIEA